MLLLSARGLSTACVLSILAWFPVSLEAGGLPPGVPASQHYRSEHWTVDSGLPYNRVTAAVSALQQKLATQQEGAGGKLDTVSGQVQSLNDSVDELKSRITKLDKSIQDLQTQLQTAPGGAPTAPAAGATTGAAPTAGSTAAPPTA